MCMLLFGLAYNFCGMELYRDNDIFCDTYTQPETHDLVPKELIIRQNLNNIK